MMKPILTYLGGLLLVAAVTTALPAQDGLCRLPGLVRAQNTLSDSAYEDYVRRFVARGGHLEQDVKLIPVVVHVLFENPADSIGVAQVQSQIDAMTRDFRRQNADTAKTRAEFRAVAADLQVEFCLAGRDPEGAPSGGITWHRVEGLAVDSLYDLMRRTQWPPRRYLNIWVHPLTGGGSSSFPWGLSEEDIDGFEVSTRRFGTTGRLDEGFEEGGVGSHEAGHYLGLYHTFHDGFPYLGQCDVPCEDTGDRVCDTPLDWILHWSTEQCEEGERFCDDGSTFFVQSENFMAYAYDTCTNMFSEGQRIRVRATLDSLRAELCSPENLVATGCRLPTSRPAIPVAGELRVFPQPAAGRLTLDFGADPPARVFLRLLTTDGRLLLATSIAPAGPAAEWTLPDLPPGIYVLHARSAGRRWVTRVVVGR